jgi:2-C-methyl-D-erythritol 4-phosphate cytidylyltransferase
MDGVILAAAGASERFGTGPSKVLRPLGGAPVFLRALEPLLEACPGAAVVVATRAADRPAFADLVLGHGALRGVRLVEGGATRQQSVARAVASLPEEVEVVLVHDAARPLATAALVRRVLEAARRDGAAAPALAVSDSVHHVGDDARISRALPRESLRAVQTPQAARADLLRRALAEAERAGRTATDEVGLLVGAGVPVTVVDGDPENLKLTVPADWVAAEAILERRGRVVG